MMDLDSAYKLLGIAKNSYPEGGVTGRPKTMCPRSNVLGPLVPQMNRPGKTMSLH